MLARYLNREGSVIVTSTTRRKFGAGLYEPQMNTDEHGYKLSVFIGVHLWLKKVREPVKDFCRAVLVARLYLLLLGYKRAHGIQSASS